MRAEHVARGFAVGLFIGAVLAVVAGVVLVQYAKRRATQGWDLTSVAVASRELLPGDVLTADDLAIRAVPEQFVTSSVVRANDAKSLIGEKVLIPTQRGDVMLWTVLKSTALREATLCPRVPLSEDTP